MPKLKGFYFVRWLDSNFYDIAAQLECYSCENFWSEVDYEDLLASETHGGLVAMHATTPIGVIVWEHLNDSCNVLNLVVHPNHRRQGVARMLLDEVKRRANDKMISAYIRESNLAGQLFFKSAEFVYSAIAPRYFVDEYYDLVEKEDAYQFQFHQHSLAAT